MATLRVHFDHQVFSLQNTGGNSRYHFELMRQLAGCDSVGQELFLGLYQTQMPFTELAGENLRIVGRRCSLGPGSRRYVVNEVLNNAHALSRGRFDIYHPTHHRHLPMVRARRMVVTHHDCTAEKFPEDFRHYERVRRAKAELYALADAIICISEASRQDLLRFYSIDPAKTRVIHHGLTRLDGRPEGDTELGKRIRREFVLYVGWRAGYKNFPGLVHAFRDSGLYQLMDLLVLGGGAMSPGHQRLISELGLSDSVIHIALATDRLLAEAYASARLLAYPSWSEGFGFPPLEAMSFGCPVLVCNASSLPEICGDAPFYYEKDKPDSLRDALLRAVSDDRARSTAIEHGNAVASRYSWQACGEQTLALYREVLG